MVLHVRFESWYISYPSSAKQQREMTKFLRSILENVSRIAIFSYLPLEMNTFIPYLAQASF